MGLRNILLFISIFIVGFCLSLYVQTSQKSSVNWDQFQRMKSDEPFTHSLKEFEEKIIPFNFIGIIREIVEKNRLAGEKTRIMEIGTGDGRVLMELKKLFPDAEFYGINKEKSHSFYRRESFIHSALKYEIFNQSEIEKSELPYIIFQDLDFGAKIPYDENKFDIIFSQNTLHHIKYKFELFNEILRVLKPYGISFHTDLPEIRLYSKGVVLEFRDALAEIRRRGIVIKTLEKEGSLMFRKSETNQVFPVSPHQPITDSPGAVSQELKRPDLGYNLVY